MQYFIPLFLLALYHSLFQLYTDTAPGLSMARRVMWAVGLYAIIAISVLYSMASVAGTKELQQKASKWGYSATPEVYDAIYKAAQSAHLPSVKLLKLAVIESGLDPTAYRVNKNGTLDAGLFQINTVAKARYCPNARLFNPYESANCAATIIKDLKRRHKSKDADWLGRYHSATPKYKERYLLKVRALED